MKSLAKDISLEMMKFFLMTSVPKILKEKEVLSSNGKGFKSYVNCNLSKGFDFRTGN